MTAVKKLADPAPETSAAAIAAPARPDAVLDVAEAEKVLPLPVLLKRISVEHGKALQQIVGEIAKLAFGPGRISTEEYFTLRLFDDAHIVGPKQAFCGMQGMRRLWQDANYLPDWFGPMSDKLAFDTLLRGYGLPAVATKAYFATGFQVPAQRMLRSREDLVAFLTAPASYPFFSKPRSSSLSLGSASVVGYDAETKALQLLNGKSVGLDRFVDDILQHFGDGYLFQERVVPHQGVRAICGERAATLRIYTLNGENGPEVFRMVWKVPGGKNMADNFWRKGNILAAVDYTTGQVVRAVTGTALDQVEVTTHPDTGAALVGASIPNFDKVVRLALDGAAMFPSIRIIGWDIVPTETGGVIIEGNYAPDFKLVEMAERRGILDERMEAFLAYCRTQQKAYKAFVKERRKANVRDDMRKFKKSAWMR